jgi:bifunctional DNase/RNase
LRSTPSSGAERRAGSKEFAVIELELVGVRVELPHNQPIVLLKESPGERFLPIWIGAVEATSIAFALQGVVTARPMTHDLMRNLLDDLDVSVNQIVVTELREGTFYAEIHMTSHEESVVVSSRPSDAIALAVRATVPIYADEAVLSEAGIEIEDEEEDEVERFKEFLDTVSPEDFNE